MVDPIPRVCSVAVLAWPWQTSSMPAHAWRAGKAKFVVHFIALGFERLANKLLYEEMFSEMTLHTVSQQFQLVRYTRHLLLLILCAQAIQKIHVS